MDTSNNQSGISYQGMKGNGKSYWLKLRKQELLYLAQLLTLKDTFHDNIEIQELATESMKECSRLSLFYKKKADLCINTLYK